MVPAVVTAAVSALPSATTRVSAAVPAAVSALPSVPTRASAAVPAAVPALPSARTRRAALPAAASALPGATTRVSAAACGNGPLQNREFRNLQKMPPATEDEWYRRLQKRQAAIDNVKASQLYKDCQLAVAQGTWLLMPVTPRADAHTSKRWWERSRARWCDGLRLRAPLSAASNASARSRSA